MTNPVQEVSIPSQNMSGSWKVELLRLTSFIQPGFELDPTNWWQHVVSGTPENRSQKPMEGILSEDGPFLDGRIVLSIVPSRVDWFFKGNMVAVAEAGTFEPLPDYNRCAGLFYALLPRWFALNIPIVRIAWAGVLLSSVENREAGYINLKRYLPSVTIDHKSSTDLMYQINRPRASKTLPAFKINRLTNWAVITMKRSITVAKESTVTPSLSTACRLEFDINTTETNTNEPIANESLQGLLDELIQLGEEISLNGDLP